MITGNYGCLAAAVLSLCALVEPVELSSEFVTNHWHVTLKEPLKTDEVRNLIKGSGFSVIDKVSNVK